MPEATACPLSVVADTIMRTIELEVAITDAAVDEKSTTIFCAPHDARVGGRCSIRIWASWPLGARRPRLGAHAMCCGG